MGGRGDFCIYANPILATFFSHVVEGFRAERFRVLPALPGRPDLNAIEQVWHRLRQLLDATAPRGLESRAAFIVRLRSVARSLNTTHKGDLDIMCSNMAERCAAVLLLEGARTHW